MISGIDNHVFRSYRNYDGRSFSDDSYFPYAKRNFENNNRIEEQDDGVWSKIDDGRFDEGLWFNSYTKPHYEVTNNKKAIENLLKRLSARQNSENYFY